MTSLQSTLAPDHTISPESAYRIRDVQVLFDSRNPMNLSLFCLGSTAAVVIVGSAGSAATKDDKAEAASAIDSKRLNIVTISVTS